MPRRTDVTITEQTTDNIDFSLLSDLDDDGDPETGINLSGVDHVELWMRNNAGGTSMFTSGGASPKLTFPTGYAAAGSVRLTPGTADFQSTYSPYRYQFKVFRTSSAWYYVPEDTWNTVNVRERIG